MTQAFSIDGVDIRINGRVLELRTEGPRTPETAAILLRTFTPFLERFAIDGMLIDLRHGDYEIDGVEWAEMLRRMTRTARQLLIAVVGRRDQSHTVCAVIDTHAARGGRGSCFQSVNAARRWLAEHLPH